VRFVLNVLNTCFAKLVAALSDEVLDRLHQAIEVERYRRWLNQRPSVEPPPPSTPLGPRGPQLTEARHGQPGGGAVAAEAYDVVEE
jgi:hypothetical protein